MKKIFLLLSVIGALTLSSCSNDDEVIYQENYFEAEVFEINQADFGPANGFYESYYFLEPAILPADMILVYRLSGVDGGRDVWELIPRTISTDFGFVDFDYNFTTQDIQLIMAADFDLGTTPQFTQNQIFRVVIIPGYDNSARIDLTDYDNVVKQFNIDETNIRELQKK